MYFRCFKRELGVDYLHRKVWEKFNGPIPEGYEVHHRDEDTTNNDISNLEMITFEEHKSKHREASSVRGKILAENGHLEKIREMTKEWHASDEGLEWHRKHAANVFGKENRSKVKMKCVVCFKEYEADNLVAKQKDGSKFCSNNCKSRYRRMTGVDDVKLDCKLCGIEFTKNKYSKKFLCSRDCSAKYRTKEDSIRSIRRKKS